MKQSTTLKSQTPIRDDEKAGKILNEWLDTKLVDYTKHQCFYIGEPATFVFAFGDYRQVEGGGYQAELSLAAKHHKFTKAQLKTMLDLFFNNQYYDNYRLIALIHPDNKQAIRLTKICKATLEGRLRKIDGKADRLLFSILKEEYSNG